MAAQVHGASGFIDRTAKAVHDEADVPGLFVFQNVERRPFGVAGVDDEGFSNDLRGADVLAEALALPVQGFLAPVEIQSRLAHGLELRVHRDAGDFLFVGLAVVGVFRVHGPGAEEKARMRLDDFDRLREVFVVAGDDHGARHAARAHAGDDVLPVFVEGRVVEVGVRVKKNHALRTLRSNSTRRRPAQ